MLTLTTPSCAVWRLLGLTGEGMWMTNCCPTVLDFSVLPTWKYQVGRGVIMSDLKRSPQTLCSDLLDDSPAGLRKQQKER